MKGLKIVLGTCAILCLLGVVGAVLPWRTLAALGGLFGLSISEAPAFTVYATRLSLAMAGLIGLFLALLARDPLRYGPMLSLGAWGLVCYGLVCLVGGLRYRLPAPAYAGDALFGLAAGVLTLVFRRRAIRDSA